jgi:glycine/D-amino acid oxidase-like deaminating enzyme
MSSESVSFYSQELEPVNVDERPFSALPNRRECLKAIAEQKSFDLVVCGGGLTAAMTAHQLALEGVRVLVLETGFFGSRGVSWRTTFATTLARAPLDLLRGYTRVRAIAEKIAPHLATVVTADPHRYPNWRGELGARALNRAWREAAAKLRNVRNAFPDLDETLLIREIILAARQEGAIAVSHVQPVFAESEGESGCYTLGFRDLSTLKQYEVRAGGVLVDPTDGFLAPTRLGSDIVKVPEVLPTTIHRVYRVEPRTLTAGSRFASFELSDGSVVTVSRTSEGVVEVAIVCAWQLLAAETADAVARDACEQAGWTILETVSRWTSGRRYSGMKGVRQQGGIFLVQERGPWDALATASSITRTLLTLRGDGRKRRPYTSRILPGVERVCELDAFRAVARAHGLSERTIELVIQRWKGRVRYIEEFPDGMVEIVPGVLRGEIDLAVSSDHVESLEDLCFAALKLHYLPGWQSLVPALAQHLAHALQAAVAPESVAACVRGRSGGAGH